MRIETVCLLFTLAAFFSLEIIQIDTKTVFLHGTSDLALYIQQPPGFIDQSNPSKVLELLKSLYGLKQVLRIWYILLLSHLLKLRFIALESDPSIYIHPKTGVILVVYVDDILIFGRTKSQCDDVYHELKKQFDMQYIGAPTTFLGLNII